MKKGSGEIVAAFYPEVRVNGYSSVDGTVEFYGRINSILQSSYEVLDFGSGRAGWFEDDPCDYRRNLRSIRGKVRNLVGCDVDNAILDNNAVDEQVQIKMGEGLPFPDASFDLIVSDYVFEHIANPKEVADEFYRILKPGGWLCARTPNKYCYVALLTRLVKNSHHSAVLSKVQPNRREIDTFPTTFKLNTLNGLSKYFQESKYDDDTYRYEAEPAYYFNNKMIFALMLLVNKLLPSIFKANLFIFLRKK